MELTQEQIRFAKRCFIEWLRVKQDQEMTRCNHEYIAESDPYRRVYKKVGGRHAYRDNEFVQLCADIDHSALLERLLSGKPALPEPPPLANAYPVYED